MKTKKINMIVLSIILLVSLMTVQAGCKKGEQPVEITSTKTSESKELERTLLGEDDGSVIYTANTKDADEPEEPAEEESWEEEDVDEPEEPAEEESWEEEDVDESEESAEEETQDEEDDGTV